MNDQMRVYGYKSSSQIMYPPCTHLYFSAATLIVLLRSLRTGVPSSMSTCISTNDATNDGPGTSIGPVLRGPIVSNNPASIACLTDVLLHHPPHLESLRTGVQSARPTNTGSLGRRRPKTPLSRLDTCTLHDPLWSTIVFVGSPDRTSGRGVGLTWC